MNSTFFQFITYATAYFACIYAITVVLWKAIVVTSHHFGYGYYLDTRAFRPKQKITEFALSVCSIVIFGVGSGLIWWLLQVGWVQLRWDAWVWSSALVWAVELLVLLVWNDVHFYAMHRLLHVRWLYKRVHIQHHRSVRTTALTAYSFHPVEAMLYGSVLIVPLLVYTFSWQAVLAFPLLSLMLNQKGHCNYAFTRKPLAQLNTDTRRHQLHHARFNGNYGFLWSFMDALCGTQLVEKAEGNANAG